MKIKKAKSRKKDAIKRKLKFEDSRHCLEAKEVCADRVDADNLREYHEDVIRNNKLKSQQRFRSQECNVFT